MGFILFIHGEQEVITSICEQMCHEFIVRHIMSFTFENIVL